jgi:hypothetical protein
MTRQRSATVVQSRSLRFLIFITSRRGRLRHTVYKLSICKYIHTSSAIRTNGYSTSIQVSCNADM